MYTRSLIIAMALLMLLGVALPVAASSDIIYLDEDFEGALDFNAKAWGFSKIEDGRSGHGVTAKIPTGKNWGGNAHFYFNQKGFDEPEQLWWRYWVRFPADFELGDRDAGKLPGPAGLYSYNCLGLSASTPEAPCWSARMLFSRSIPPYGAPDYPQGPDGVTQVGFYAYYLNGLTDKGTSLRWDRDVASLTNGEWYCIEGYTAMNTPGVNDGVLQGWVDGRAAFSRTDIAFRRLGEEYMAIQEFWFLAYYGGVVSPADNQIQFDSLVLSSYRVGCDDTIRYQESLRDLRGSRFPTEIRWMVDRGISLGCNPPDNNRYCPKQNVTRGQMAAFLARALSLPARSSPFTDTAGSGFEGEIGALVARGITKGCAPDRFCPREPVTREQMAAFLRRALALTSPNADSFTDDNGSPFESDIEALRSAGISDGCGPTLFCPEDPVTRGQMAAFLYRALG